MSSLGQPPALVFDIDGTLVDSVDLHATAWQLALAHFGIDVTFRAVRSQIGKGGDNLLPVFVPAGDLEKLEKPIESYRGELFKKEFLPRVRPFPKVRTLFERAGSAAHPLGLASSARADEIAVYKRLADITDLVTAETSADDVDCSKPCPDVFEVIEQRLGMDARNIVVVGDTPYDMEAAGRAGMRAIGVLCGGFPAESLHGAGCIALFRDPSDLLARFDELESLVAARPVPRTRASRSGS